MLVEFACETIWPYFSFLGIFLLLIWFLCWLSICSHFLFPPVSILVVDMEWIGIYSTQLNHCVFIFICFSMYLLFLLFISWVMHSFFSSILFNLHVFVIFLEFFLGLTSNFIALWSEKMDRMISIFLNLLRLVLWPNV